MIVILYKSLRLMEVNQSKREASGEYSMYTCYPRPMIFVAHESGLVTSEVASADLMDEWSTEVGHVISFVDIRQLQPLVFRLVHL